MDHLTWRYTDQPRPLMRNFCTDLSEADLCSEHDCFLTWQNLHQASSEHDDDIRSLATRCQSWLFLGLAKVIAQTHLLSISITNIISTGSSSTLSTHAITKAFAQLEWSEEQSFGLAQLLLFAQNRMLEWFALIKSDNTQTIAWTEESFNVFWSTALFHEWLWLRLRSHHQVSSLTAAIAQCINSQAPVIDRLKLAGWCPTVLQRKPLSLLDTWPLVSIPVIHSLGNVQMLSHDRCEHRNCQVFNVDESNYHTQHTTSCDASNHCRLREVAALAIEVRIADGIFPVIQSVIDDTGLHISVVDGDKVDRFTAISHVWAGGLGNFNDNSVYECQLEGLHHALSPSKTLRSTVYYWLDTLCVPVNNETSKQKAIGDMARIYASAQDVYVLDPILQRIDTGMLKSNEKAVLVAASPWMARSWTLQEAALAVRLRFQFHDILVESSELDLQDEPLSTSQLQMLWHRDVDRLEGGTLSNLASPKYWFGSFYEYLAKIGVIPDRLRSEILQAVKFVPTSKKLTPEETVPLVWQELLRRNSTKTEDVATIIAVLMGRSAKEVLDLKIEERIPALLRTLKSLPTFLLFAPTVDSSTGSWCPKVPTCSVECDTMIPTASLKFVDGGFLELSEEGHVYLMRMAQPLCLAGTHVLNLDLGEYYGQVEIKFADLTVSKGKKTAQMERDIAFVLPKDFVHSRSEHIAPDYPGIYIQLQPGDGRARKRTIYRGSVRWKILELKRLTDWNDPWVISTVPDPDEILPAPSQAQSELERSESSVISRPPGSASKMTLTRTKYPILLDMGFAHKRPLKWSRQDFYPFEGHSVRTAKPLFVIMSLKLTMVLILGLRIGIYLIMTIVVSVSWLWSGGESRPFRYALWAVLLLIFIALRVYLGELEESRLREVSRIPLQRIWASSFKVNGHHENAFATAEYLLLRKIRSLIGTYCLLCLLALALLPFHARYLSYQFGRSNIDDNFAGRPGSALFFTAVDFAAGLDIFSESPKPYTLWSIPVQVIGIPYCLICLELSLRFAYIMWTAVRKYVRPHQSIVLSSTAADGSRSIWFKICARIITAGVALFLNIVLIFQFIESTRAEERNPVDVFLPITGIFCTVMIVLFLFSARVL